MESRKRLKPASRGISTFRTALWWFPTISLLVLWLVIFLNALAEGRTLSYMAHWTIGFWWREVNHSPTTRIVALLFATPSLLLGAIGLVRKDQRFIAAAVFLSLLTMTLSLFILAIMFAGSLA
jgi:hypothetical protein